MSWDSGDPTGVVEVVECAQALAPIVAAGAEAGERGRRVTDTVMDALHQAKMFRLLLPRPLDGAELNAIWQSVGRLGELTIEQRMLIRLAATFAIHQAQEVVDTVYHAAGATAVFQSSAFERRFRDIHTVTQQLQGRQLHFETVGQFLLGLEPDLSFA